MRKLASLGALALIVCLLTPKVGQAGSAPDEGTAWSPRPLSKPLYSSVPPDTNPEVQRHFVEAHDGVDLYVETWLPGPTAEHKPPQRMPTILIMTPYVSQGVEEYPGNAQLPAFAAYFNARGFAVAQHHVRGTGESGGCLEQTARNQWDDGARVVEYLGKRAPWSNGAVGMYGASYDAETQISTAAFGDPKRTKYLKAIIPTASVGSQYDWNFMDGVAWTGQPLVGNASYLAGVSIIPGNIVAPQHYPEKFSCQGEVMGSSADALTGNYTAYWREREYRTGARKVKAATLMVHGLRDFNVQPITLAGFFNRLPESTPHKGLFGVWNHAFPGRHPAVEPEWTRADWYDMVTAWFDRYLKGLDTGVERWPDVQLQSSDGQWWEIGEFPTTGGPPAQLALGPDGSLGVATPSGSTSYREQLAIGFPLPGEEAVFETPLVKKPLHITGQPVLDLWLTTSQPDGHVAAKLEVIGTDGEPMRHLGSNEEFLATYGVRSLQHLEPMRRGWFEQESMVEPAVNKPLHVFVRFLPTDLEVPRGGSLRLTVSGSVTYSKGDSQPSASGAAITLLHNCEHPSALRFLLPSPGASLLNVRETDEKGVRKLPSNPATIGKRDGAGLATAPVCGKNPKLVPFLTLP